MRVLLGGGMMTYNNLHLNSVTVESRAKVHWPQGQVTPRR